VGALAGVDKANLNRMEGRRRRPAGLLQCLRKQVVRP
jgi:hypothetical protein